MQDSYHQGAQKDCGECRWAPPSPARTGRGACLIYNSYHQGAWAPDDKVYLTDVHPLTADNGEGARRETIESDAEFAARQNAWLADHPGEELPDEATLTSWGEANARFVASRCPQCGAELQATAEVWLKLNEQGFWEFYGVNTETPRIYCANDHYPEFDEEGSLGPEFEEMTSRYLAGLEVRMLAMEEPEDGRYEAAASEEE